MELAPPRRRQSRAISLWFAFDAVVALAPPFYWAADGRAGSFFGLPIAICYFLAVDICIAASIVAAYLSDRARGEVA
jgi:hypothetical protein